MDNRIWQAFLHPFFIEQYIFIKVEDILRASSNFKKLSVSVSVSTYSSIVRGQDEFGFFKVALTLRRATSGPDMVR